MDKKQKKIVRQASELRQKKLVERKMLELEAQLIHVAHFADHNLANIKPESFAASGVLLQLTALGGREIIPPVVIKDGLSQETIDAIRRDLVRSFNIMTEFKPKGPEPS